MSGARTFAAGARRFRLDADEVTRLVLALAIAAPARAGAAAEAAQLRMTQGTVGPGADAVTFPRDETRAVLRALEVLRARCELSPVGEAWHDALRASARVPTLAYRVEIDGARGSVGFVSRSGRYVVGDRLSAAGAWLEVERVEPTGAEPVLVCRPLHVRPGAIAA